MTTLADDVALINMSLDDKPQPPTEPATDEAKSQKEKPQPATNPATDPGDDYDAISNLEGDDNEEKANESTGRAYATTTDTEVFYVYFFVVGT